MVEGTPCCYHGGHQLCTLKYEHGVFSKLDFDSYGKEKMTHSLQDKIAAEEGHQQTMRPWESLHTMLGRAVIQSDTKVAMAQIGISLHAVKSKSSYSCQFVCLSCMQATDVLFPVCDDRFLRDQADKTMLQFFSPYFKYLNICVPAPAPPPPMRDSFAAFIQPLVPAPHGGSRSSRLLVPNVAELNAGKWKNEWLQQDRDWDTETTASVTSRCGKCDGSLRNAANAILPYIHGPRDIPPPAKWKCYWNHGRNQQPVDATPADTIDVDGPETACRRAGAGTNWKWTGYGHNDWEWLWSWNEDGQWEWV